MSRSRGVVAIACAVLVAAGCGASHTSARGALAPRLLEQRFARHGVPLVDLRAFTSGDRPILRSYVVVDSLSKQPVAFVVLYQTAAAAIKAARPRDVRAENVVVTFMKLATPSQRRAVRAALRR